MDRSSTSARPTADEPPQATETAIGRDGPDREEGCGDGAEDGSADDRGADHLADLPDGAGCTEIWEHLSGRRSQG